MSDSPSKPMDAPRRAMPAWLVPLVALVVLVVFTIIYELATKGRSDFVSGENLFNILRQWSFVGIIAVGMTMVIILGGIDLSVGSLVAFVGGLAVLLLNSILTAPAVLEQFAATHAAGAKLHLSEWLSLSAAQLWNAMGIAGSENWAAMLAVALALAIGCAAGLANGLLVTVGRIAPFIATLGGLAAYRSLALAMAGGGEYRSAATGVFRTFGQGGIAIPFTNIAPRAPEPIPLLIPWPVVAFVVVAIIGWIVLNRTRYGRYVYAIGGNERAAIYSAIRVTKIKIITYVLLGLCTGLAGVLLAGRMNSVSSSGTGVLYELDVIAAVVIGGTSMRGGRGTIIGTVIGVLVLGVIGNMLNLLQVSTYLQGTVKGLIIIAAVLLQRAERTE